MRSIRNLSLLGMVRLLKNNGVKTERIIFKIREYYKNIDTKCGFHIDGFGVSHNQQENTFDVIL